MSPDSAQTGSPDLEQMVESGVFARLSGEQVSRAELSWEHGEAVLVSRQTPANDHENQDAACAVELADGSVVLAVADGAGGQPMGRAAAEIAIDALRIVGEAVPSREHVVRAFEQANQRIVSLGVGAATTLVVAEISPTGLVRTYHAGDSVAYLFGQRGAMKAATMAHNPAAYAVEAGLISEDEAHDHAERSMLTNCLGVEGLRIEIGGQIPLARRDTLLLASDGITDNLTRDEIVEICRKGPLDRCAETLVRSAVARMTAPEDGLPSKPDDATAVLFRLPK